MFVIESRRLEEGWTEGRRAELAAPLNMNDFLRCFLFSGADRDRTGDPLVANQVLSQLSYRPLSINLAPTAKGAGPMRDCRQRDSDGATAKHTRCATAEPTDDATRNADGTLQ